MTQPHDFGAIDHSCFGLIELPAAERDGLLWVHPQPDGELDVDSLLGDLAPELAGWHAGDRTYRGETVLDKTMNGKRANDQSGATHHSCLL